MLETALHADNAFVTLTYSDERLNYALNGLPTLVPLHLQLFFKRLRKASENSNRGPLRYYAVGEYGDESWRPHYHVALFNYPACERGRTGFGMVRPSWQRCCVHCALVGNTWQHGNIYIGNLEADSAQYVAQYTTKKMTHADDPRLKGRHPEFARMSLRPGIGANMTWDIASTLLGFNLEKRAGDVPVTLRHGKTEMPLGRYLRRLIRRRIGKEDAVPEETLREIWEKEMRPLLESAKASSENPSLSSQMALANEPYNLTLKHKLQRQRKKSL